jgi:MFS family permease
MLLIAVSAVFAISLFGILILLRVLHVLRLAHGPEYVGLFSATSAFAYMVMSLPSGALGRRYGRRRVMLIAGIVTVAGMVTLPLTEALPPWAKDAWPIGSQMVVTAGWSMLNINLVPALMAATTNRNRSNAYALGGALRGPGTLLGIVSGGMLPGLFASLLRQTLGDPAPYGGALWMGAAVGLLRLTPLRFVGDVRPVASQEPAGAGGSIPLLPVTLMIAVVSLRHGGWATSRAFYNAYVDTVLHLSPSSIGLIAGVGQFVTILAALLTPRLAARRSNGWALMVTTLGMAISVVRRALIPHWVAAGLPQLSILVFSGIWMPARKCFRMRWRTPGGAPWPTVRSPWPWGSASAWSAFWAEPWSLQVTTEASSRWPWASLR